VHIIAMRSQHRLDPQLKADPGNDDFLKITAVNPARTPAGYCSKSVAEGQSVSYKYLSQFMQASFQEMTR